MSQPIDHKNIRRRVYDALNVLMAMNIISKEKKEIRWIGLPTNSVQECQHIEVCVCVHVYVPPPPPPPPPPASSPGSLLPLEMKKLISGGRRAIVVKVTHPWVYALCVGYAGCLSHISFGEVQC